MPYFARMEARANRAVLSHLTNAMALLPSGVQVPVIFDDSYADVLAGDVSASDPKITGSADFLLGLGHGASVTISGDNMTGSTFTVASEQPDGVGLVSLILRRV